MHKFIAQQIIENQFPYHPAWVTISIIACIMLVGYVFFAFQSGFIAVIKSLFNRHLSDQFLNEKYSLAHPVSIFLLINFLLAVSLYILLSFVSQKSILHLDLTLFSLLKIMLLVFAVYVIKIFVIRIMGFIFDKTTAARQYIFLTCLINQVAGVGLIPIIVFVAYAPQWLSDFSVYLGAIILASTYLLRIGKGIFSNLSHRQMPAIYLLLYLCTLEVLPVLFAYKLLSEADF